MHGLRNKHLFREACFINGRWIEAYSGKTFPVYNPADGKIIGRVPECSAVETRRAIWRCQRIRHRPRRLKIWRGGLC